MKKKYYLAAILLIIVGFAAVSTTLYLSGSTNIIGNKDDFNVYYSNAKVNGVQDLSVVESETSLRFNTELDTLGQTYVIEYDVTNSSKNYDADLEMVCTGGDTYLTVTNEFDDTNNLLATETRVGTLTLELAQTYTGDSYDVEITCELTANAVERTSLGTGTPADPVKIPCKWDYLDVDSSGTVTVGDHYSLCEEDFDVIDTADSNVTLFASNVLGTDFLQNETMDSYGFVSFVDQNGWEYTPGPREIDIQKWSTNPKNYINQYVSYLQKETGDSTITGDLITLEQLGMLGCVYPDNYAFVEDEVNRTCVNSKFSDWLINGQYMWTRSATSDYESGVWIMTADGILHYDSYWSSGPYAIRPVVTISKDTLNNL